MNQMKKLLGRKASLPRYLAAHPTLPSEWEPGEGPVLGSDRVDRGFPAEGGPQQPKRQSVSI